MSPPLQLKRVARNQKLPLSADQYRIWFLHQLTPDLIHFNINYAFNVEGAFDIELFARSLNAVVERHEALRTTFEFHDQTPEQRIHPGLKIEVPTIDLSSFPQEQRAAEARRLMELSSQRVFSLEKGPLLRAEVYSLAHERYALLLTIHHIVADYDSVKLITRELFHFYKQGNGPSIEPLEALPIQYADYAWWQNERTRRGELNAQLDYWKAKLGGEIPVLRMPMDRPRQAVMTNNGAVTSITFGQELTSRLKALSKANGVTLFVALYSAYQVLLQRYTGQLDINVGTPITTRNRPELRSVVGLFINTLVLTSELEGDPSFVELVKRNRKIAYGAFARQEIPYEKLVDDLKPQRNLNHNLFFQTMVMFLETESYGHAIVPGLDIRPLQLKKKTTTFELTLTFAAIDDTLKLTLDYNTDLYEEASAKLLLARFDVLLQEIVKDPTRRLSQFEIVPAEERERLVNCFARGAQNTSGLNQTLHELISEQARRSPSGVAVRFRSSQLAYSELDSQSNQVAHWLLGQGVTPGAIVGLAAHRSLEMLVGILGILKAGAAYLPIDPNHPKDRIEYMLDNSGATLVVASDDAHIGAPGVRSVSFDNLMRAAAAEPATPPNLTAAPSDLAYVMYTSGSTGQPKGVMVTHRSVVNHCMNMVSRFRLSPDDRVLQFASIGFDVSVQEIFPTLVHGATLVLWKDKRLEENGEFLNWTAREGISILNLTTAHWNGIVADLRHGSIAVPKHLKLVVVGGESVTPENWVTWDQLVGDNVRFINDYGLTETTVTAAMFEPNPGFVTEGRFPIGSPLDNVEVYVLDGKLGLLPSGVFGELHVGGAGVARGYIGLPALTKERFIVNPYGPGALFKTGDRARFRADGNLEFEGRVDEQVKIRGHRVEVAEVEARIVQFAAVREAVVLARDNGHGSLSLIAYLVARGEELSVVDLKTWLKQTLPDYMVPADYVLIDAIPLTVHGKVDKGRLPARVSAEPAGEYLAPRNATERMIGACWEEILKRSPIGVASGFFDIGGDSLLATVVIARLKQRTKATIPLKLLFEYPVLADFARAVDALLAGAQSGADKCLVKLRQSGTKTPLFYVHPVGGSVSCYFALSRYLGVDQPFYALQSHAMVCKDTPLDTIEKMAKHYLTEIREVQPRGPYRLGGWSMGGFIAYEMARLLHAQGEETSELSMIDTYLTKTRQVDEQTILYNFALQLAAAPGKSISPAAILAWEGKIRSHVELCDQLRAAGLVPAETSDAEVQHLIDVYKHTVQAFKQYDPRPSSRLALPKVILFRARDSHEAKGVWSELVENVALYHVDADHFGIVHHPEVGRVLSGEPSREGPRLAP